MKAIMVMYPLDDPVNISRMQNAIIEFMKQNDAPEELYARMGFHF